MISIDSHHRRRESQLTRTIQLILTDIDGTIALVDTYEVSERVRHAVITAEEAGIMVVPVSGRPYELARGILEALSFDGLCVLDGGASIRKASDGELVWSKWLAPETLREIVGYIAPHCVLIDYSHYSPEQVDSIHITQSAPYVFARVHAEWATEIMEQLDTVSGINAHLLVNRPDMPTVREIQVTHTEGNKRHGVHRLLQLLHVDPMHVMAIGDGNNDLPLFENAGLKIAMGNAAEALKAAADHVVGSVREDGFAEAVELFVLPKP